MSEEERQGSFHHKKVGPRAAIVAAAPIGKFYPGDRDLHLPVHLLRQAEHQRPRRSGRGGSARPPPASRSADIVTAIDGSKIDSFSDMQRIVSVRAGEQMTFTVKRGDSTLELQGHPQLKEVKDPFGNAHKLGVLGITRKTAAGDVTTERVDPATRCGSASRRHGSWSTGRCPISAASSPGAKPPDQVGGPLRIAQISGQVATIGLAALVHLAAVLSISIGLLNLFPVPLLDGGHLLFYAVEAVRGRPLSERAQEMGFRIGLGLVLMLMVFATYNDILHLAAS